MKIAFLRTMLIVSMLDVLLGAALAGYDLLAVSTPHLSFGAFALLFSGVWGIRLFGSMLRHQTLEART